MTKKQFNLGDTLHREPDECITITKELLLEFAENNVNTFLEFLSSKMEEWKTA